MKTMKVALLATAALAAVSVSARADDTAAIKAQLEALTARIARLEAAPAVPVGFSLLTISEGPATQVPGLDGFSKQDTGYGDKATIIGIMPTADMPASTTIEWSGYVRAAIVYSTSSLDDGQGEDDTSDSIDVFARGQLKVVGKTDTSVGEVGARIQLRGQDFLVDTKSPVTMNEAWGWWAMTPELTLGGGYTGTLGNIGYGYDGACSCYYVDNADVYTNPGDTVQMRLSWASGPLGFAVAIEDADGTNTFSTLSGITTDHGDNPTAGSGDDGLGVAAKLSYKGDTVSGEIGAAWREHSDDGSAAHLGGKPHTVGGNDSYIIGAGLGFSLGDMASLSLAANVGQNNAGSDFWDVNGLLSANLSDTVHGELGAGYKHYGESNDLEWTNRGVPERDTWSVMGGLYYEPVSQLTIGLEAEYSDTQQDHLFASDEYEANATTVDVVSVFRF